MDKQGNILYSNTQMNSFFEKEHLDNQTIHSLMYENENLKNDVSGIPFWMWFTDILSIIRRGCPIRLLPAESISSISSVPICKVT